MNALCKVEAVVKVCMKEDLNILDRVAGGRGCYCRLKTAASYTALPLELIQCQRREPTVRQLVFQVQRTDACSLSIDFALLLAAQQ